MFSDFLRKSLGREEQRPFAAWLAAQLQRKGWTQADLAREAGLSRQAISYYMSKKSKYPGAEPLAAVCKALGVPYEQALQALGHIPADTPQTAESREAAFIVAHLPDDRRTEAMRYLRYIFDTDRNEQGE